MRKAFALLAFLAMMPAVGAQGFDWSVEVSHVTARLRPSVEQVPLVFTFEAPCRELLSQSQNGGATTALADRGTSVYIVAMGPRVQEVPIQGCGPTTETLNWTQTLQLSLAPWAPGLEALAAQFTVYLNTSITGTQAGAILGPAGPKEITTTIVGAYIPLLEVDAEQSLFQVANHAKATLNVTNHGNAKTVVTFRFSADSDGSKASLKLPEPVTLNAPLAGFDSSQQVEITFDAPDGAWTLEAYRFETTVAAFIDPTQNGTGQGFSLLFRNSNGLERAAPSPPAALAAPLLLAMAVLVRRRA